MRIDASLLLQREEAQYMQHERVSSVIEISKLQTAVPPFLALPIAMLMN